MAEKVAAETPWNYPMKPFQEPQTTFNPPVTQTFAEMATPQNGKNPVGVLPTIRCGRCNYRTAFKSHMTRHLKIHQRQKTFLCSHCPFETNSLHRFKYHVALTHYAVAPTSSENFKCPILDCHFVTDRRLKYRLHLESHVNFDPQKTSTLPQTSGPGGSESEVSSTATVTSSVDKIDKPSCQVWGDCNGEQVVDSSTSPGIVKPTIRRVDPEQDPEPSQPRPSSEYKNLFIPLFLTQEELSWIIRTASGQGSYNIVDIRSLATCHLNPIHEHCIC